MTKPGRGLCRQDYRAKLEITLGLQSSDACTKTEESQNRDSSSFILVINIAVVEIAESPYSTVESTVIYYWENLSDSSLAAFSKDL